MKAAILRRVEPSHAGVLLPIVALLSALIASQSALEPVLGAWSKPEYSHAWLIPPLALLVFVHRLNLVKADGQRWPGVVLATLSFPIMLFGWAAGSYTATIDGVLLGLCGFVWSSFGTGPMRLLAAPLTYLLFMVPVPVAIFVSVSADMQLISSEFGTLLIRILGLDAGLDGNIIVLPSARLEVAEACSGLRYLFPLVSFAFLVSMLLEDSFWKKALIVASSFPIAVMLNAGRIAMIAVLLERFGLDTSSGPSHTFEGFAVFLLCLLLLALEVSLLARLGGQRGRFVAADLLGMDRGRFRRLLRWPVSRASWAALSILVIGTAAIASLPERMEHTPQRRPFALFPMEFSGWRGAPRTLDNESLSALGLTDYLLADFINDAYPNRPLNVYVAYYASQRNGLHAHSPQLCIPGGGWSIIGQSAIDMPWQTGGSVTVNRVVIEKKGLRQIVYYWFEERGRHIARESVLKYYALRDALVDKRSDGALVRIVMPTTADNDDGTVVDRAARDMVRDLSAILQPYVPNDERRDVVDAH
jgi:exosortase D (VPLPA-CTERM-specific)